MLYLIVAIGVGLIAFMLLQPRLQRRRRQAIANSPFPTAWVERLNAAWPLYRRLPDDLRARLQRHISVFLTEKQFFAARGLVLTEEIRLLIAAQACLLVVNKSLDHFDSLRSIIVYPSAFVTNRDLYLDNGLVAADGRVLSGEAWEEGKIVIAWDAARRGGIDADDGANVVIHEFAHLLDHENGDANGAPLLESDHSYEEWSRVFSREYDRLCQQLEENVSTFLDPYAATDPAEFFAVSSELFFENGAQLRRYAPALYEQLARYYRLDPARWNERETH